jgi:hypothetical protein
MTKRALSSVIWFFAVWLGYEIAWSLIGVPRALGPVIATAIAAFVAVDPMTLFWPRTARIMKSNPSAERSRLAA